MRVFIQKAERQYLPIITMLRWIYLIGKLMVKQERDETYLELGKFYYDIGYLLHAEEAFGQAASSWDLKNPVVREAMHLQAMCFIKRDEYHIPLVLLEKLSRHEDSFKLRITQALCYHGLELWDQAALTARKAYIHDPFSKEARLLQAVAALHQGNLIYAEIIYDELLSKDAPEYIIYYQHWFESLCALKKYDKAARVARQMIRIIAQMQPVPTNALCEALRVISFKAANELQDSYLGLLSLSISRALEPQSSLPGNIICGEI
jgi:tetratricopeptide (TPR) repeat protein